MKKKIWALVLFAGIAWSDLNAFSDMNEENILNSTSRVSRVLKVDNVEDSLSSQHPVYHFARQGAKNFMDNLQKYWPYLMGITLFYVASPAYANFLGECLARIAGESLSESVPRESVCSSIEEWGEQLNLDDDTRWGIYNDAIAHNNVIRIAQ